MKALKERILRDGKCFEGGILKVDNFINRRLWWVTYWSFP